ncbi:MAG: RNB domain-containing ribonuclease, partial [Gammaproteobacteria bacterium]
KFDLQFSDGSSRKVREKDFRFIHPQYTTINDTCPVGTMDVLQDFEGESLTLKEITEWIFDDYTAKNAWCTYLLVEDSLYFYWTKDTVFIRPSEQVEAIQNQRDTKRIELESLNQCVEHINNNCISDDDSRWLQEVELVAYNLSKHAKLLDALSLDNKPESAHKLLIKIGYWQETINPYPRRHGILADENHSHDIITTERRDLTHLNSYAIDNSGSNDADDAISVDGDKIWIHIADVASQVGCDSGLDSYAQNRISNLYLPDQIIHMLPPSLVPICSLGEDEKSRALSVGFKLIDCQISDIEVVQSEIKVEKLSYDETDEVLSQHLELSQINTLTKEHKAFRNDKGALRLDLPNVDIRLVDGRVSLKKQAISESREMIAEMMVIAGRAIAQFALENNIAMPFVTQGEGSFSDEILQQKAHLTLSQMFKAARCFKRSKISTKSAPHSGLGLDSYLRVTSPIRRYLDLVAQQQLLNFIHNKPILDEATIKSRIGQTNIGISKVNKATRQSTDHFKCLFLKQNKGWNGVGTVVELRGNKATVLIPELGMITQLKLGEKTSLDDKVQLKISAIDFENRLVDFKSL